MRRIPSTFDQVKGIGAKQWSDSPVSAKLASASVFARVPRSDGRVQDPNHASYIVQPFTEAHDE